MPVDTTLLGQLNDFDPAVRKQAIIAIGRSKDPAALPYLATVVRTDPEQELRELARKAGQYIQQNAAAAPAAEPPPPAAPIITPLAPAPAPPKAAPAPIPEPGDEDIGYLSRPYSEYEEEDAVALAALGVAAGLEGLTSGDPEAAKAIMESGSAPGKLPVRGQSYVVTDNKQKTARDLVEAALTANLNNDNGRAMRYLYQALMTNPNLINDDYFAKIASGVTDKGRDEAIQMVLDQGERKSFIKTQDKAVRTERKEKHLGEARKSNWMGVLVDVIIFMFINTAGPLAVFFAISEGINNLDPTFAIELDRAGITTTGIGFAFFLPIVLWSAISSILSLFLMSGIIHVVATLLLRGTGTYAYLLTQLLGLYNRFLLIIYVLMFVAMIILFVTAGSPMVLCVTLPIVIISLVMVFKTLGVVGNVYDFGLVMGCLSVLAAYVVLMLISFGIGALFANTLLEALSPLLTRGLPLP
ncbi:MAG: HEAT repeat domain-containing protein [Anaerolineae bacterium]|nr:HEAT repeat domain-containing protein [Anaerolineae bacterium]